MAARVATGMNGLMVFGRKMTLELAPSMLWEAFMMGSGSSPGACSHGEGSRQSIRVRPGIQREAWLLGDTQ